MGFYLERDDDLPHDKAKWLIEHAGAKELSYQGLVKIMHSMAVIPNDMMLVCVVDNGNFEGAGIVYDEQERNNFAYPDGRPRHWLLVPKVEIIRQKPHLEEYVNRERDWRD
jgi:hypothetical protein